MLAEVQGQQPQLRPSALRRLTCLGVVAVVPGEHGLVDVTRTVLSDTAVTAVDGERPRDQ